MKIQVLGTGGAIPTLERALVSVAVQGERSGSLTLFECGEGTQLQLLRGYFKSGAVDRVCITHGHIDHCLGLPGLIARYHILGRRREMTVMGTGSVLRFLTESMKALSMEPDFVLKLIDIEVEDGRGGLELEGQRYEWTALRHRVPTYAYRVTDLSEGSSLVYCGDNSEAGMLRGFVQRGDLLIHEATFTNDIGQATLERTMHSRTGDVAAFAESAGAAVLMLNHMSPRYSREQISGQYRPEAEAEFSGRLVIPEDLDLYRFKKGQFFQEDAGARGS